MEALDEVFLRMTETNVSGVKKSKEERDAALLRGALDFYNRFAEANREAPELQSNVEQAYRKVIGLYSKLSSDRPQVLGYRRALASTTIALAGLLQANRQFDEAEKAYGDGLGIQQELVASLPAVRDFREELATTHKDLARSLEVAGQSVRAEEQRQLADKLTRELEGAARPTSSTGVTFTHFKDSGHLELVGDAIVADDCLRPSPGEPQTCGAVWLRDKQLLALGFETTFTFRMQKDGGGGLAFVIQNHERSAVAGGGSGMGYGSGEGPGAIDEIDQNGIPNSVAVEFDPSMHRDNLTARRGRHISVQTRGTARNSARPECSLGIVFPSIRFNNGQPHVATIRYVPGSLSVCLDDPAQPILTIPLELETTLDLDQGRAWIGFTAATYSNALPKEILNWQFEPLVQGAGATGVAEAGSGVSSEATLNSWIEPPTAIRHAGEDEEVEGEATQAVADSVPEEDISFLNKALAFYEELASLNSDAPDIRRDIGKAYWRSAGIQSQLKRKVEAFESTLAALKIWRELADDFPDVEQYQSLWRHACLAADIPRIGSAQADTTIASLSNTLRSVSGTPEAYLLYLWRGRIYYWNKRDYDLAIADHDEAIDQLSRLIAQYPHIDAFAKKLAYAYYQRGDIPFHQDNYEAALPYMEQAVHYDPELSEAFDHLGQIHFRQGHMKDALADYSEAIRLGTPYFSSFAWRAKVYSDMGELDKAIADCGERIRRWPNSAAAYASCASYRNEKREYDLAIADCDHAIRLDPQFATAYCNRATGFLKKGELDKALADCEHAIRLDPGYAIAYQNRGTVFLKMGELDKALADCDEAIRLDPQRASAYYSNRANVFLKKGEFDKALADCDAAIRLNPQHAIAYNNRGTAFLKKGERDKALADFDEAIRLDPQHATAYYYNRGGVFAEQSEWDKALADFDAAIRLDPQFATAYNYRGTVFLKKGELDKALADFDEAIRLDPQFATAYNYRGTVFLKKGELDKALADFDEAIQLDPQHATAYYDNRGGVFAEQSEWDKALADFDAAIRLNPESFLAYYFRTLLKLQRHDFDGYRQECAEMLAQFGDTPDAATANLTAWTCCLAPASARPPADIVSLAERAVQSDSKSPASLTTLGAALYRAGQSEEAIERLHQSQEFPAKGVSVATTSPAYGQFFLAMACSQLGRDQQARRWLTQAIQAAERDVREQPTDSEARPRWNRRLTLQLLREEAEELLNRREEDPENTAREKARQEHD